MQEEIVFREVLKEELALWAKTCSSVYITSHCQYSSQKNKHLSHPHSLPSISFFYLLNIYTHNIYKLIDVKCMYTFSSNKNNLQNITC